MVFNKLKENLYSLAAIHGLQQLKENLYSLALKPTMPISKVSWYCNDTN